MSRPAVAVLLIFVLAAAGLVGCSSGKPAGESVPDPAESPGAALVEQRCTMCHTLDRVYAADYDQGEWLSVVERMERNGLVIAGDEKQSVIEYLAGRK